MIVKVLAPSPALASSRDVLPTFRAPSLPAIESRVAGVATDPDGTTPPEQDLYTRPTPLCFHQNVETNPISKNKAILFVFVYTICLQG